MMAKMMQLGNGQSVLWIVLAITQSFHFCTLEEYYIGGLYLGPFNGVTDGSAPLIAIFLLTGITGNDIWLTEFTLFSEIGPLSISQYLGYTLLFT